MGLHPEVFITLDYMWFNHGWIQPTDSIMVSCMQSKCLIVMYIFLSGLVKEIACQLCKSKAYYQNTITLFFFSHENYDLMFQCTIFHLLLEHSCNIYTFYILIIWPYWYKLFFSTVRHIFFISGNKENKNISLIANIWCERILLDEMNGSFNKFMLTNYFWRVS